ncbi:OPT family oligopeptide transporter [Oleisolibacter albus]|uniref:OPT family oligopeptide transporter n=1 Tax=Oleisolibacter albus TaxID=2171757 RepID=UPI000DF15950|nr:oligopeptide transporter, OPT family [Oleisolibacter albus]
MQQEQEAALPELTLRGIVLGALITVVFTAANVFLGLKVGLTFASSIPAAVISMAVLRLAKGSNIRENNIVQTIASSAGTLSSIIFVLPGLVMVGYWTGFPFWQSAVLCAVGGILGVLYTVPLRRAMVVQGDLPYPEGVAAAEILKVGSPDPLQQGGAADGGLAAAGMRDVVAGGLASAGMALLTALRAIAGESTLWFKLGGGAITSLGTAMSLAMVGVGYLVGIGVGIAMLIGIFIAWGIAVPVLTSLTPIPDGISIADHASALWRSQVRLIGAGAIAVAAVWTLILLARPMVDGIRASLAAMATIKTSGSAGLPRTERDIPFNWVTLGAGLCLLPLAGLFLVFMLGAGPAIQDHLPVLVIGGVVFAALVGFIVASACGYMAGLIGSSNSPISGIGIVAVISGSVLLLLLLGAHLTDPAVRGAAVAFALFATSVVLAIATIANDNLQDLKTGQLVGATPWRQQVALIIGVLVGAAVIPPILDLMLKAWGFAGMALPPGMDPAKALAAPQATLMATLAQGILSGDMNWTMLGIGALVGIGLVVADEGLRRTTRTLRLPPLAVALGIYLPMASATMPVVVGTVVGWFTERTLARRARQAGRPLLEVAEGPRRRGTLLASGLIVGEGLFGIVLAALIVATGEQEPLGLLPASFGPVAEALGAALFLLACLRIYRWIVGRS